MIDVLARRRSNPSPLRYPGGKASLAGFFEDTIQALGLVKPTYVEPYAGGAGAGLDLLYRGIVGRVVINDFDYSVYSLWDSMLHRHEEFLDRFDSVPLTVEEWKRQREIYRRRDEPGLDKLDLGFATFFLNRTNRSGVLRGGMIGGLKQEGTYKLDARFNKETLRTRIEAVGKHRSKILVSTPGRRASPPRLASEGERLRVRRSAVLREGQCALPELVQRRPASFACTVAQCLGRRQLGAHVRHRRLHQEPVSATAHRWSSTSTTPRTAARWRASSWFCRTPWRRRWSSETLTALGQSQALGSDETQDVGADTDREGSLPVRSRDRDDAVDVHRRARAVDDVQDRRQGRIVSRVWLTAVGVVGSAGAGMTVGTTTRPSRAR